MGKGATYFSPADLDMMLRCIIAELCDHKCWTERTALSALERMVDDWEHRSLMSPDAIEVIQGIMAGMEIDLEEV